MQYLQSVEPNGNRVVIPANRIKQVIFQQAHDGKYRVDVWHEGQVYDPYIVYNDTDETAALEMYYNILRLIGSV